MAKRRKIVGKMSKEHTRNLYLEAVRTGKSMVEVFTSRMAKVESDTETEDVSEGAAV